MALPTIFQDLDTDALRSLLIALVQQLTWRPAMNDQLTHGLSLNKCWRFGVKTEGLPLEHAQQFEEPVEAEIAAMTEQLFGKPTSAKRKTLPPELPRNEINHERDSTTSACGCQEKRIGEDVVEKIDYTPGGFSVEFHVCGNLVSQSGKTLVTAHVIVKNGVIV